MTDSCIFINSQDKDNFDMVMMSLPCHAEHYAKSNSPQAQGYCLISARVFMGCIISHITDVSRALMTSVLILAGL